jgi:hypothetical protein
MAPCLVAQLKLRLFPCVVQGCRKLAGGNSISKAAASQEGSCHSQADVAHRADCTSSAKAIPDSTTADAAAEDGSGTEDEGPLESSDFAKVPSVAIQDLCMVEPNTSAHCYLTRSKLRGKVGSSILPDPRGNNVVDVLEDDLLLRAASLRSNVVQSTAAVGTIEQVLLPCSGKKAAADAPTPEAVADGVPLGDGLYAAERIEEEKYCYKSSQVCAACLHSFV